MHIKKGKTLLCTLLNKYFNTSETLLNIYFNTSETLLALDTLQDLVVNLQTNISLPFKLLDIGHLRPLVEKKNRTLTIKYYKVEFPSQN